MSEKSSKDNSNSSEGEEPDICVSALKLRNDMKRRVHNGIEKRRKDKINYWIHKLAELLPFKEAKRESKTHLLENLYQYINQLKERNDSLMFGNINTVNAINVEEIRRLTKRCKDLEEKNINYYRLLEMAGISPNGCPQDIQFERPTKYSKKITEQQLNEFLAKSSDKKSDQMNGNKRMNDFDENSGQKKKKTRNRKRRDSKRDNDWKSSPPTPVLPNLNPNSSSGATTNPCNSTPTSAPIVLLNDQHMSTVSADETPRLIVSTSDNGLNALNTIQIRPTVGSQQLQFLSTGPSIETIHSNTNLLSGQLLFNLNPPPPQPQATAVLLPNGQILPIITQRQPQQQSLIYAPNQSFLLANTGQPTLISGQTASIPTNITTNTIKLIQNSNEIQKPKPVSNEKPKEMTTTIESIPVSPKPIKKKNSKNQKKSILESKVKNSKNDNNSNESEKSNNCEIDGKKSIDSKDLLSISDNKSVDKPVINTKDRNRSNKSNDNISENIGKATKSRSKSKPVLTESRASTQTVNSKSVSNCDILAKATQSIFSPPPKQVVSNSNSNKEVLISNNSNNNINKCIESEKHDSSADNNNISDNNKCKKRQESVPERTGLKSSNCVINSTENEVISGYSANRATSANKAIQLINDTNNDKNDNYVENRNENNSKIEKTIASGNKAEICKQSANNQNTTNASANSSGTGSGSGSGASQHKLANASTPDQTNTETISSHNTQSNAIHRTGQAFEEQNITQNSATNATPDTNRLNFGFSSEPNQTNINSNRNESTNESTSANQSSITDNELPTLLLSSLNDENEVSGESAQSVSNSSLPAFLSLSPEHLNEYLPKDNITNNSETAHPSTQLSREPNLTNGSSVQFRLSSNVTNVEQHSTVRQQESAGIAHQKEQQNYSQYSKSNESSVAATAQTETRTLYSSNFPTISSLINNDYSEFALNSNKSMFATNNSNNYLENLNPNPLMNHKMNSQNNNFLQFPLQNDNSLMPSLYSMHSYPIHNYLNNNTNSNTNNDNSNRNFFPPNDTQTTLGNNSTQKAAPNPAPNPNQSQSRQTPQTQASAPTQQPLKATQVPQPAARTQAQNQSNPVMPMRSQRHPSTEQQLQHNNVRPEQQQQQHSRHPSQHSVAVPSSTTTSNTLNKTTSSAPSVQYSTQNSFSSYSAEALIRQNEPSIQQIQSSEQNRYASNGNASNSRIPQQTHNSNMSFSTDSNAIRSSSRASISYSAESLIQSNSMTNSTQMSNKSTQREVTNESLNTSIDNNNRISYYQHIDHNINTNTNPNLTQRTDPNNSNNLFNFDHSLNSRLMASTSNPISQNCSNSYPQITFNSHLPTTTSSESVFPTTSNTTTVNTNSNRNTTTNSNNSNNTTITNNSNNNVISHPVSNLGGTQPQPQPQQHSPVVYPTNNSQNSNPQQSKRSANNSFNPSVNAFIHSNVDSSYANPSNSSMYSTTGSTISETNLNANPNHYQRSARNNDIRFTNCLQPTNQNTNTSMAQHNNPNAGCFFSNTAPNTTYFPSSSTTPFPALLPSSASPFDATAPFSGAHRPPMFPNSFMPDFNPPFVNTGANNPLPPIGSNFNLNPSVNNNSNSNNSKSRETQASNTRSSSNMSRSPNQSKNTKMSANSGSGNAKSSSKKQNNSKHNHNSDNGTNSSSNTSLRHLNDNYFSMNDLMSTTPQTNNRYSNFLPNSQTHNTSRQTGPSQASASSTHSSNSNANKNPTSSADTTSSYTLFRPQSQNINNASNVPNVSNSANFSVNSLHNTTTTTPSNFGSSGAAHHSSHATNFHLSNIFPDINNSESLSLSPMKFPPPGPPVTPVVPPPVGPPLSQTAMDVSAGSYQNYHPSGHHQNLYNSHHSSARISHNAFNTFLSSGTPSTHNTNSHSFDPHITPNNRTASTPQMSGISANATHPTHHSHHSHTYANIVPNFTF